MIEIDGIILVGIAIYQIWYDCTHDDGAWVYKRGKWRWNGWVKK